MKPDFHIIWTADGEKDTSLTKYSPLFKEGWTAKQDGVFNIKKHYMNNYIFNLINHQKNKNQDDEKDR